MRTWMDSIRLAERKLAQRAAPVFMYRLDWQTPILDGALRSPPRTRRPAGIRHRGAKRGILETRPEPQRLADVMSQAWINFARSGDPSPRELQWLRYDTSARKTMIFDVQSKVVPDPDREVRMFWSRPDLAS